MTGCEGEASSSCPGRGDRRCRHPGRRRAGRRLHGPCRPVVGDAVAGGGGGWGLRRPHPAVAEELRGELVRHPRQGRPVRGHRRGPDRAVLGAVGAAAVLSRPHAAPLDVLPTFVGVLAGLWALNTLWGLDAPAEEAAAQTGGFERRRLLVGGAGLAAVAATAGALGRAVGGAGTSAAAARAK